jgi:putative transposase
VAFYRRHLPHWDPDEAIIFLTWHIYGSMPRSRAGPRPADSAKPPLAAGQQFAAMDRLLDQAPGPRWLNNPQVAEAVADTLFVAESQWQLYDLFAWVIMSNHVHVLLRPHKPLREVTRAIKSNSARLANRILNRAGLPFWQDESFDHWVRNAAEFKKIVRYIEMNPVAAGLVERPEQWPWSSANPRFQAVGQVPDLPVGGFGV